MISPASTGYETDNTSSWITVSHHPKDVIVISSNSLPDPDLSDQFIHATAEQICNQLINLTTNLPNVQDQCLPSALNKVLKIHQHV